MYCFQQFLRLFGRSVCARKKYCLEEAIDPLNGDVGTLMKSLGIVREVTKSDGFFTEVMGQRGLCSEKVLCTLQGQFIKVKFFNYNRVD